MIDRINPALKGLIVPLASLHPDPDNARKHNTRNLQAIKDSFTQFGQQKPIVALKDGTVIAGNGTIEALQELGWEKVAVVRFDDKDKAKAIAYAVADNRTAELASWDDAALAESLKSIQNEIPEFDLVDLGFIQREIQKLITHHNPDEDVVPVIRQTNIKPKTIFTIGTHRLMCGDSTQGDQVAQLMGPGGPADMVITSPPYNVGINYNAHNDRTVTQKKYMAFLQEVVKACIHSLKPGRSFVWNIGVSTKTFPFDHAVMLRDNGLQFVRQFIWEKTGVPLPSWYHTVRQECARVLTSNFKHEMMYLFSNGPLEKGGHVDFDDTLEHDVFQVHQSMATVDLPEGPERSGGQSNLNRRSKKAHPAAFPVRLPSVFIQHMTEPGEIVLDPFGGSGSTLIACEKMGRHARLMEIDPVYCQVIIDRWEAFTGKKADYASR